MDSITSLELGESINVQSPNYPEDYPSFTSCTIWIDSSDMLVLQFHDIDIEGKPMLYSYGYLAVNNKLYNGNSIVRSLFML